MKDALSDYLQIWGFENDTVIYTDGSVGTVLNATQVDISCWEDEDVNAFIVRLGQTLNSIPNDFDLQFINEIAPDNGERFKSFQDLQVDTVPLVVKRLVSERVSKYRDLAEGGKLPSFNLKIALRTRANHPRRMFSPSIFSKERDVRILPEKQLQQEISKLETVVESFRNSLTSLEIQTSVVSQKDLAQEIYFLWNPSRPAPLTNYDTDEIRPSLLFSDVSLSHKGFMIGDQHIRVISLKQLPEQTVAGQSSVLDNLPLGSKVFVTINIPDQQSEISKLQTQRRIAFSMAQGSKNGVNDLDSEAKLQDLESLLSDMIASGEKVFNMAFNVVLSNKDEGALDDQVEHVLSKLRELSNAEGMEENLVSFDIFSDIALPNARSSERIKKIKTSNLSDFLPVFSPWKGHDTARLLLRNRSGGLVAIDPFDSQLSNYNQIVSGGSGSGKSFLTNLILLQMLKENPKIFVIDIGGSYQKLCENLEGQYIHLGLDSGLSINPFDLSPDQDRPGNEKIKFLVGLVEMMSKEDQQNRLGRLERTEIENCIIEVYERTSKPKLSDLKNLLLNHGNHEIARIGKILSSWCGNTPYGHFVDQTTNVELHKAVVSFDLKGMETHPDLQSVCLYIITDMIWREFQKERGRKKFLVMDECWRLLENDAGASFIAETFRTFRKYYASAIAISQNIDDFANSKVASAILPNSSIKWVLMQKGADRKRLQEVLQLNDNEMELIASLHQKRGSYSEAFLMAQGRHCLVSIEPTPLEYWIATTDPRDLGKIEELAKNSPTLSKLDLLEKLSKEYPAGVPAT